MFCGGFFIHPAADFAAKRTRSGQLKQPFTIIALSRRLSLDVSAYSLYYSAKWERGPLSPRVLMRSKAVPPTLTLSEYTPNRLRRLCRKLMQGEPAYVLPGERLTVLDVHSNMIPAERAVSEHTHSFYEAHIVFAGEAVVGTPRPLTVSAGTALLLPPGTPHAWETREEAVQSFVIWFSREESPASRVQLCWAHLPGLLWLLQVILLEVQASEPGWPDRVSALLSAILSRILAFTTETREVIAVTEDDTQLVALVERYLWDSLARPLAVADVAAHVGMSERTLYRRFRELTGQTLVQRLLDLRIQRAQTLLEEGDAALAEIGTHVGMPDPAYFCRVFKGRTSMTPLQYRLYMRP